MKALSIIGYSTAFLVASGTSAFAYIDPGTGSMVLQAVIAVFAAIGTGIGVFWSRITGLFRSKKPKKET